ncbi:MAG: hypothetical protein Salg2KO_07910 [Salibacteraceae bacterium]
MKNFTRITALLSLVLVSSLSYAQFDLEVSDLKVTMSENNELPDGLISSVYCTIENLGDAITQTDTMSLGIVVNNDSTLFALNSVTGDLPNGTTLNLPHSVTINNQSITFRYEFTGNAGTSFNICAYAWVNAGESDSTNNVACQTVTISDTVSNDWSADEVLIVEPADLDGFDIWDNGEKEYVDVPQIDSVRVTLTNNGSLTYTERTRTYYDLVLGTSSVGGLVGTLAQDLIPGASTQRVITDNTLLAALTMPDDSGDYEMCAVVSNPGDENNANDESCAGFTIVNSYKPPENVGIEDAPNANLNIFTNDQNIQVQGIVQPVDMRVMDMNGKIVTNSTMKADGNIPMTSSASGIYIIEVRNSVTGEQSVERISIQ